MTKKALVFYFHGYMSSPATDKVIRLKEHFPETFAFSIDPDPDVSIPYLTDQIENVLLNHVNDSNTKIFFVGTSLGSFYALAMASEFPSSKLVLINPPLNPEQTLVKLGMNPAVARKYTEHCSYLEVGLADKIFLATKDELLHFDEQEKFWNELHTIEWVEANHRFNGPEFDKVIDYIKTEQEK